VFEIECLHIFGTNYNVWQKCIEVYGRVGQCRKAVLIVLALPIATKKQRTLALLKL
jgi:hypothetical protein